MRTKKCKICKIYKDISSIGKEGVCQDCKNRPDLIVVDGVPPLIRLRDHKGRLI